jgi:hypothetical protein
MKVSFGTFAFSTAILCAAGFANAPGALAQDTNPVCLQTDTMVGFERVDRKTLRFNTQDGRNVLVTTKGSCALNERNPVRLIPRNDNACLMSGDTVRGFEDDCRVRTVTAEEDANAS